MIFKNLQEEFKIRYKSKETALCVFSGAPLFIFGDIGHHCGTTSLIISLSAGTAAAVNVNTNHSTVSICRTCDNIIISYPTNKLGKYYEENYTRSLFHMLFQTMNSLHVNFRGAEVLFENSTEDNFFHNYKGALLSAVALILNKRDDVLQMLSKQDFFGLDAAGLTASMILKEEQCLLYNGTSRTYARYSLPLFGKKIIIIKTGAKTMHLPLIFANAYSKIQKNHPEIVSFAQLDSEIVRTADELREIEKKVIIFSLNEEKRMSEYPYLSDEIDFHKILNNSGRELYEIVGNSELAALCEILSNTDGVCAHRPLADNTGVFCIAADSYVDGVVKDCESRFEKKVGYRPAFYICNTAHCHAEWGV